MGKGGAGSVAAVPEPLQQSRALRGHTQSAEQGSEVVITATAEENKLVSEMARESEHTHTPHHTHTHTHTHSL